MITRNFLTLTANHRRHHHRRHHHPRLCLRASDSCTRNKKIMFSNIYYIDERGAHVPRPDARTLLIW